MGYGPGGCKEADTTERLNSDSDKGASPRPGGSDGEKLSCISPPSCPTNLPKGSPEQREKLN